MPRSAIPQKPPLHNAAQRLSSTSQWKRYPPHEQAIFKDDRSENQFTLLFLRF